MSDAGDLLRAALMVLDERGWCRMEFSSDYVDGPVCAVGALNVASTGWPGTRREEDEEAFTILDGLVWDKYDRGVIQFNDAIARDVDHVKSLLGYAAEQADKAG